VNPAAGERSGFGSPHGQPGGIAQSGRNYRSNRRLIEGIFGGWFYERSCEPKTIEAHHGWRDFASNTHLRGDVRCRALLRGVKSEMVKTLLSMPDLRRRALAEIRQQPGCHNVQDIAINRVTDESAENNWSLCVVSAGATDANSAARAALYVQSVLRRDYDLMTD
jgi:hypothetical protein